jgi:hypothetical protein
MTTTVRLLATLVCASLLVTVACNRESLTSSPDYSGCLETEAGAQSEHRGLVLLTCPLGEHSRDDVSFFVGLTNRAGRPYLVDARFELFGRLHVTVEDQAGTALTPESSWEPGVPQPQIDTYLQWILPQGGVMGRTLNLACDVEGIDVASGDDDCAPLYPFEPGLYTVSMSLRQVQVCQSIPCSSETQWTGTLETGPIEIRVSD